MHRQAGAHAIQWARTVGKPTSAIDVVMGNSFPLLIIRDLHNSEKHPKDLARRSGKSPILEDIRRVLTMRGQSTAFTIFVDGLTKIEGDVGFEITAVICDAKTGDTLGRLDEFLSNAVMDAKSFW